MNSETKSGFRLDKNALSVLEQKRELNAQLFAVVAPRYDLITRGLSLGRDAAWKRTMLSVLPDLDQPLCLDLACGTGDIASLLGARYPGGRIVAIDLVGAMLKIAGMRGLPGGVQLLRGDMMHLTLADACVDVVTGSYAIRNAPDLGGALDEVARVLKPGGCAAFLDFSKPAGRRIQAIEFAVLKAWGSFWGLLMHGNPGVYGYIAESLKRFPDRDALRGLLAERGFRTLDPRRFFGGVVEVLWLQKEE